MFIPHSRPAVSSAPAQHRLSWQGLGAAVCCVLGLLLSRASADDDSELPFVVAHRGLLLDAPENTLANFRGCLELGIGFELDVQRSKDGHLVCVHDETVERTTDGRGQVSELTLEQLKSLDAGSWFDARFRGQQVPSLNEVFEMLAGYVRGTERSGPQRVLVAVDIKGDDKDIGADIVHLAQRHRVLNSLLMIGRTITVADVRRRLRSASRQAHVACLANTSDQLSSAIEDTHSDWVYVRYVPSGEEIAQVHRAQKRMFIAGPTVASLQPQNWRRVASRGIDAILTDYSLELSRQLRQDAARRASIWSQLESHFSPPEKYLADLGHFRSPLKSSAGPVVRTASQWSRRRREIADEWHEMLGPWPPLLAKPRIKYVSSDLREDFAEHRVQVEVYPGDQYTEGHLLVPRGDGPFPAALVTFYDSTTSVGLGERGVGTHDYGLQLARRGFVTLSVGTPGSIDNPDRRTRELLTDAGETQQRQPLSFLAYVAANCHTALAELPQVDGERIGIVGLSYGGKWSMFASCLHDKFACAVWSDPGIVFDESNANVNYWEPWYLGYEPAVRRPAGVPNAERPRTGLYKRLFEAGRDLNELQALICPRPMLLAGGTEDPPHNWRALNHLVAVNKLLGHDNRVAMTHRNTHLPTPAALEKTLLFMEYFLKYQ